MEITEEMWEEAVGNSHDLAFDMLPPVFYSEVMKRILKKSVHVIIGSSFMTDHHHSSEEELRNMEKYLLSDFCFDFHLTPGCDIIASMGERTKSDFYKQVTNLISERDIRVTPTILFGDNVLVFLAVNKFTQVQCILYTSDKVSTVAEMIKQIRNKFEEETKNSKADPITCFDYLSIGRTGNIKKTTYSLPKTEINLNYYNDDLPIEDVKEFLTMDKGGVCIFHGEPGTGKSSFIKYMMQMTPERKFVIISPDLIIGHQEEIRTTLLDTEGNKIIVIEECEKLLTSREMTSGNNTVLSDILNLSDGILGDMVKTKFIFTFNTKITKIDSALLRKGRCKVKYEFKPLTGEKLENLNTEMGLKLSPEEIQKGIRVTDLIYRKDSSCDEKKVRIGF